MPYIAPNKLAKIREYATHIEENLDRWTKLESDEIKSKGSYHIPTKIKNIVRLNLLKIAEDFEDNWNKKTDHIIDDLENTIDEIVHEANDIKEASSKEIDIDIEVISEQISDLVKKRGVLISDRNSIRSNAFNKYIDTNKQRIVDIESRYIDTGNIIFKDDLKQMSSEMSDCIEGLRLKYNF